MASPPILNFETLLAPIPGANPTGEPLPFPVRKKLDDSRKEIDPNQFAPNDPRRPETAQLADWPGIEQLATDTLAKTSKDLLVAVRLTEALVKRHGFGGLRDGLRLLRRLTQDCWDRIYPVIQDGDLEPRAGPFEWLDDELKGARFPYTLRTAPLVKADEEKTFGWQQWKDAQDAKGAVTAQAFEQAVTATPREYCQNVADDLAASAEELNLLSQVLGSKMGEMAPGLAQLRKTLLDCQDLAQQILKRKGPPPAPAPAAAKAGAAKADGAAAAAPAESAPAPRPLTRDDVLARLADASALLLQLEPQSPVAYLVQRAVRLARLPLPDLMKVLIRDPNILSQLDRDLDLGLEKQQPAAAAAKK
jgi:type VI secretion system protein ImpA